MEPHADSQPHISKQVLEMLTVANEYCYSVENHAHYPKNEFCVFLSRILPLLYIKGSLIPVVTVQYPEATEHYVTEEQWESIYHEMKEVFGNDDSFWSMQHGQYTDEPVKLGIAELLTDIYQDLKDFVILYQSPYSEQKINAVDEVRRLYKTRWGLNATLVLTAIHLLVFPHGLSEDSDVPGNQ